MKFTGFSHFLNLVIAASLIATGPIFAQEKTPTPSPNAERAEIKGNKEEAKKGEPGEAKKDKRDKQREPKDKRKKAPEDASAGEKKPEGGKPEGGKPEPAKDKTSASKHSIQIQGRTLNYSATAGTMALFKADGSPRANVFYISYMLQGDKPEGEKKPESDKKITAPNPRPITFCFNGGPGSSSVWLHMGAFGPRRVVLPEGGLTTPKPPFQLTDNEFTLLETTDLVFIDPVSTGFSRAEKGEDAKQFHGFNEDVESVGDFIRQYVTRQQRWQSPKFLMGESYGGIRASGLSSHLQERFGMYLNGIIIVSGVLDFQTLSPEASNDLPYIAFLPSITAVAHFHKKLAPDLQNDFKAAVAAAEAFARGPYAAALLKGTSLTPAEREEIAASVSRFTSFPKEYVLRENLRIDAGKVFARLLESQDKSVGRYDARVIGPQPGSGDPSYDVVYGPFASTFNAYVRGELQFENDQPYEILTRQVQPWNYQSFTNRYVNVNGALTDALVTNPSLKVYIACGWYDLATPYGGIRHTVDHLDIDANLRANFRFGFYEGGHMMYTNLPELQKLSRELTDFINASK